MDLLAAQELRYQEPLTVIREKGVLLSHLHIVDGKPYLKGSAPNENVKNEIWDAINAVNEKWATKVVCDIGLDTSLPQPVTTYTVAASDSL